MTDLPTFTVIKADCGSPGGHTQSAQRMLDQVERVISQENWVIDHKVANTGDDIAFLTAQDLGTSSSTVHRACRARFSAAAETIRERRQLRCRTRLATRRTERERGRSQSRGGRLAMAALILIMVPLLIVGSLFLGPSTWVVGPLAGLVGVLAKRVVEYYFR